MGYLLKFLAVLAILLWIVGGYYFSRGSHRLRTTWVLGSLGLIATAITAAITR